MTTFEDRFPHLLAPINSPGATGRFVVTDSLPPEDLIGNAYIVPRLGGKWLYFVQANGRLQFPGGKKEPGESHRDTLDREALEEAGISILSASPIGHWLLRAKSAKPLHPHLPHPDSAGVVYCGFVQQISAPTNPEGSGQTADVRVDTLPAVVEAFRQDQRHDLAELYLLASELIA